MTARRIRAWWMPDDWRLLVFPDEHAIDEHLAALLVTRNDGALRKVALASGKTFAGFFATLRQRVDSGRARFDGVAFHHLDEFEGVAPGSPGSLAREIAAALFPDQDPRRGTFHRVDARAGAVSVATHEAALRACDLVLAGIGTNGHLAFNEPGTPLASHAHVATLSPATRDAHAAAFEGRPVPERALTAGLQTIVSAREIVLVAHGGSKAPAIRAAICDAISSACPASVLRLHDRVTVLLDERAAAGLENAMTTFAAPPFTIVDRASSSAAGQTLVVAPHPDDASISCGGLIANLPANQHARIVTFSTGARAIVGVRDAAELRERESTAEAAALGAHVTFLRARAYDTGVFEPADSDALLALLEQAAPARILLPARDDPHPTHRSCRLTAEDAILRMRARGDAPIEVWTFEGPWFLLARDAVNVVVRLDPAAHAKKQQGIRAHQSQIRRVPFEAGSEALERLRALTFSESHLGGKTDGGFDHATRVECYRRLII